MSCTGCEATVEEALNKIAGVTAVSADHERDTVTVAHEGSIDEEQLTKQVVDAGYTLASFDE